MFLRCRSLILHLKLEPKYRQHRIFQCQRYISLAVNEYVYLGQYQDPLSLKGLFHHHR